MTQASDLPEGTRAKLERVLSEAAGIALSSVLGRNVESGLQAAATLLGCSREALLARLDARDPGAVAALLESVLVHESHFFRHPEQLEALKRELFVTAPRERPLSIWSAGCAAGEEPYTLAMALVEAGRERCRDRIVATDVSTLAIAAGREAVYGEWAVRQLGAARRARFFSECGAELLRVAPALCERVQFQVHELVNQPAPGEGFDVVFCRNLLVYLSPEAAERVLRKLVGALAPGGYLVLAPAELGFTRDLPLEKAEVGPALLLRTPDGRRPPPPRAVRERRYVHAAPRSVARGPHPATPARARPALAASLGAPRAAALSPDPRGAAAPAPLDLARAAAQAGDLDVADRLAREVADREHRPEAYLLVGAVADARGDLAAAADATRRALYLDPCLAQGHAALVSIFRRLGRLDDARRARRNAMALLEGLDDPVRLPGVEEITVGALRAALQEVRE